MSLPIFTTEEDIDAIVSYLKTKPTGATTKEAKAVLQQTVDPRKLTALTFWGIISKDGDKIKLASRGWDLARKSKNKEDVLKEVLDSIVPYRSALEWMFHQKFESVTNSDIAAHWHEHHSEALGSDNENTIKDQAVCFFRIADAAGLGKMILGRRESPTRLEIQRENLINYVEAGPTAIPLSASIEDVETNEEIEDSQLEKQES